MGIPEDEGEVRAESSGLGHHGQGTIEAHQPHSTAGQPAREPPRSAAHLKNGSRFPQPCQQVCHGCLFFPFGAAPSGGLEPGPVPPRRLRVEKTHHLSAST